MRVQPKGPLVGRIRAPGDKSISHRALMFNGMASGTANATGLLESEDLQSTRRCLEALGVSIEGDRITGAAGTLQSPKRTLDCGNSGTTVRLLMGILAGQNISATLTGDASLQRRPMGRVSSPLQKLGARFSGSSDRLPVTIHGGGIENQRWESPVASAQVKTAMMLAAIQGEGTLVYVEPHLSRDHTERMMRAMGIEIEEIHHPDGRHEVRVSGGQQLVARDVDVPGDISSAAFFMVAASIVEGSDLVIEHVGLNPSRCGVLDVLRRMGADIEQLDAREVSGEPVADLRIRSSGLMGTEIGGSEIPRLVDELPILAVAAAHAAGPTVVRDASELRVKESDRILGSAAIVEGMGINVETTEDGFVVHGQGTRQMKAFEVDATGDHRIAMSAVVAGLSAKGETVIHGACAIASSFPQFMSLLEKVRG
jgi:3-phosphoshikimate 1-carboxyvinyltransferase